MSQSDFDYQIPDIYICSTRANREYFAQLKEGFPINSTWLEEAEVSADRRLYEATMSRALIFYYKDEEPPLEYLYEVGAALAAKREVIFCADARNHELALNVNAKCVETIEEALLLASELVGSLVEETKEPLTTYAFIGYHYGSQPAHPADADLISISAHSEASANDSILLPYPAGYDWAQKICKHIDEAYLRGWTMAQQGGDGA